MSRSYHRPVHRPSDVIDNFAGSGDPAEAMASAYDTAAALLHRVRSADDPKLVEAVMVYTESHGVDDVAELWENADAHSLPGAMWRLYALRQWVVDHPNDAVAAFRRGLACDEGTEQAGVGVSSAPSPSELSDLAHEILRGAFSGDFAVALERAAAFCRTCALGSEGPNDFRATADELTASARAWRTGRL